MALIALSAWNAILAQLVINTEGEGESEFSRSVNKNGHTASEYYISKGGKVYFDGNSVGFASGSVRFQNIDGLGEPIYLDVDSSSKRTREDLTLPVFPGLLFRADSMRCHWGIDENVGYMMLMVDAIHIHGSEVLFDNHALPGSEIKINLKAIELRGYQVVLEGVSDQPFVAGKSFIHNPPKDEKRASRPSTSCEHKLNIRADGTLESQDLLVRLNNPNNGEIETLLRNVTLTNEYRNRLLFTEIHDAPSKVTALVYFDKGQSVCIDGNGNPVSGTGRFSIETKGQVMAGWLGGTNVENEMGIVSGTQFEFDTNPVARFWRNASRLKKITVATGALCLTALLGVILAKGVKRSSVHRA